MYSHLPSGHAPAYAPVDRNPRFPAHRLQRAVTIIELLVAMVVSLILILAVVQGFQVIANTISESRAVLEMSGRVRLVMQQLQEDLEGATCTDGYQTSVGSGLGYTEILEGFRSDSDNDGDGVDDYKDPADSNADGTADYLATYRGDPDDVLMFTTRRFNEPFLGRVPRINAGNLVPFVETSYLAEVAYWTSIDDRNENNAFDFSEELFLHRRALLLRPDLISTDPTDALYFGTGFIPGTFRFQAANAGALSTAIHAVYQQLVAFHDIYDVSARVAISKKDPLIVGIAANSLADLTRRGSRFAHVSHVGATELNGGQFIQIPATGQLSYPIETPTPLNLLATRHQIQGDYAGEDVAIADLIAFDVRAFDYGAPVRALPPITASASRSTSSIRS